jgi:toxin YoeB
MNFKLILSPHSLEDLYTLYKYNHKLISKSIELLIDVQKQPFQGIGKPEHLKYFSANIWSRRINDEHRLIYEVAGNEIIIFSFIGHYEK